MPSALQTVPSKSPQEYCMHSTIVARVALAVAFLKAELTPEHWSFCDFVAKHIIQMI
jgi:hypothetical protein